jgi:thioredoxin reductase
MPQFYDAIIVGAGPAGVSCAVWLTKLGLSSLLIEASARVGGLTNENPFHDDWIAVLPHVTGQQVAANLARSVEGVGVVVRLGCTARSAALCAGGVRITLADKDDCIEEVYGHSLVIASGVRAKGLPGQSPGTHWPGVVVGPGSAILAQDYTGLSVAVLGGGDNAFENFVYVRNRGARAVRLYARTVRAQQQWVARVSAGDLYVGPYQVDPAARTVEGRPYDLILVFYGWEPCIAFTSDLNLERDERGYICTRFATAQTSVPNIYAIGEAAHRMHPCVVTALADGVVAAKAIQRRREQSG